MYQSDEVKKNSFGGGESDDPNNRNQAIKMKCIKNVSVCAIIKIFLSQKYVINDKTLLEVSLMCLHLA